MLSFCSDCGVNKATGGLDDDNKTFTDCLLQPQSSITLAPSMPESKTKIGKSGGSNSVFRRSKAMLPAGCQTGAKKRPEANAPGLLVD
jgi:hypothetical protein